MAVPSVTIASFDAWAGDYDHSPLQPTLYLPVHRTTLGLARRLVLHPRRILDVGCGTARLLRQARQHYPQADLVGVDPARHMLTTARSRTSPGLRIRYVHAAAEQLPFVGEAFELVVATLSLRHWTDQDAGIGQVARALTPGGVLVVADVFPTCRHRIGVAGWLWRRRLAVPAELATVLAAHGLTVIAQDRTRWFALPDVQVIAAQKLTSQRRGSGLATLRPRAVRGSRPMKRMRSPTVAWRASVVRGHLAYGAVPDPARIREGSRASLGAIYCAVDRP